MTHPFSVSRVIKDGVQKTVDCMGELLKGVFFYALAIILVAVVLVVTNIGFAATLWHVVPDIGKMQACGGTASCVLGLWLPLVELLQSNLIAALYLGLFFIGYFYLVFGFLNYTLRVYDAGTAGFGDLFPSLGRVIKVIIAAFIFCIMIGCGLVLLVIPGIYFMLRFGLFVYFILDKDAGIIASLSMSWRITRGHCWQLIALLLYMMALHMVGHLTIIGWLFVFPLIDITRASTYRQLLIAHEGNQDSAIN